MFLHFITMSKGKFSYLNSFEISKVKEICEINSFVYYIKIKSKNNYMAHNIQTLRMLYV